MRVRVPFRHPEARWWLTPMRAVILLTWSAVFVPRILNTLTAPKFRLAVGESGSYSPIAAASERGLQLALMVTCLLVVLGRVRRLPSRIPWRLIVLLMPWIYLLLHDLALDIRPQPAALLYGVIVIAIWVLQPDLEDLRPGAYLLAGVLAVSVLLGMFLPEQGILTNLRGETVSPTKAILPLGVLIGPLTSGNNLGQVLVIGAPWLLLLPRWTRPVLMPVMAFALVWTASRSSLTAVGAALLTVAIVRKLQQELRAGAAFLAATAGFAVVLTLPFLTDSDTAFTNRGVIWRRSLDAWNASPLFGLGSDYYGRIGGSSDEIVETAYHGHNQTVQLLVTGGAVLLVLFVLLIGTAIAVAARWAARGQSLPLAFVVSLLVSCTLEVSVGFVDRQFLLPVVVLPLAVILLSPGSARTRNRMVPQLRPQMSPRDPSPTVTAGIGPVGAMSSPGVTS